MNSSDVDFQQEALDPIAFRATPKTISALVPDNTIGTYLLLNHNTPVYVGRSDTGLKSRLMQHEHLHGATHVLWSPRSSPLRAYLLEAAWYHRIQELPQESLNQVHPARPDTESGLVCPFCGYDDEQALREILPYA